MKNKPVTKQVVAGMITHRLSELELTGQSVPFGDYLGIGDLQEGESLLVKVRARTISPGDPMKDEIREYKRINKDLCYQVWKKV